MVAVLLLSVWLEVGFVSRRSNNACVDEGSKLADADAEAPPIMISDGLF
jgi:hypothetical protein